LQSGPLQQVKLTESAPEGTGEYPSSRFWARQYPSAAASSQRIRPGIWPGWISGELPGQVNEQLTSWPPSADQPPAGV
jgi:hypothetical protein